MIYTDKGAWFSRDRVYRYGLTRRWGEGTKELVVIGLNPSTADESQDDPTIRRCVGLAMREGCSSLLMLNIFALRATDPKVMMAHPEPVGPHNDLTIAEQTAGAEKLVVAAWGVHGAHLDRGRRVARLVPGLRCFGVTKDGHPKHPLYLSGDAPLVRFSMTVA